MSTPAPSDPLIGKVVAGRYRIDGRIGKGAFGTVYRVQHLQLDRPFALKALSAQVAEKELNVKRFEREAKATAKIGHENIVEIVDYGQEPGIGYYFVMEHLEGETLLSRLRRDGPLKQEDLVPIACQICEALAAAHEVGVIHRDLKPENVFLARTKKQAALVKLLDFGIAGMADSEDDEDRLTRTGSMLGTPAYMSPEQAAGERVDYRADLYGLGILIYEMATGKVPFKGPSFLATLEKHRSEAPMPPRQARPELDISEALESIILKLLRKDKEERYLSAKLVVTDLLDLDGDQATAQVSFRELLKQLPPAMAKARPVATPVDDLVAEATDPDRESLARHRITREKLPSVVDAPPEEMGMGRGTLALLALVGVGVAVAAFFVMKMVFGG